MTTPRIMWLVCAALLPAYVVAFVFWGVGVLGNLCIAAGFGLLVEGGCLLAAGKTRGQISHTLTDGSTIVTAALVALALPPGVGAYLLLIAMLTAIGLAKHLYGGLGNNPFNPAMTGYAVVLVSFPAEVARWPTTVDGTTGATALDSFFHRGGQTVADVWVLDAGFGSFGGAGFEWVNVAVLVGGCALVLAKIVQWRMPLAVLTGLGVCAALGYDAGSSGSLGSPLMHWFSGGTMLAAFFIATDPVTHPTDAKDQWLFGLFVGVTIWIFRAYASYPDGIAFAVLLANCLSPLLDKRRLEMA